MRVSNAEYSNMVKEASPNTKSYKTMPAAFLVGGLICVLGQLLLEALKALDIDLITAGSIVSVTLIFLSALLTGCNVYDNIGKFGGAGSLVPITGFANAVVSPALEFKTEGYVLGLGAKMFIIAGPVIVYGTLASVVYGFIYWIFTLI